LLTVRLTVAAAMLVLSAISCGVVAPLRIALRMAAWLARRGARPLDDARRAGAAHAAAGGGRRAERLQVLLDLAQLLERALDLALQQRLPGLELLDGVSKDGLANADSVGNMATQRYGVASGAHLPAVRR